MASDPRHLAMPRSRWITLAIVAAALTAAPAADAADPFAWTGGTIDSGNSLFAVSCPSEALCVAVDDSGNVVWSTTPTDAGSWTVDNISATQLHAIDCPSASLCVAVDNVGNVHVSTDPTGGPTKWTSTSVNGGAELNAVSCPITTFCVAGGGNGNIVWKTTPAGAGTWTVDNVDGTNFIFSLSCPTISLCAAGNDRGDVLTSTDPSGGPPAWEAVDVDPAPLDENVLLGMSCPSTSLCVASDDLGSVVISTNPTAVLPSWTEVNVLGFSAIYAMNCASPALCVGGYLSGVIPSTNPTGGSSAWAATPLGGDRVTGLSCPTESLCVGVRLSGNAAFGRRRALSVARSGSGSGTVTGTDIACPGTCSAFYPDGTAVTLTATPAADGSTFAGWGGDCSGTGDCVLTMSAARAVTATFNPPPPATTTSASEPQPQPSQTAVLPRPEESQTANVFPVRPGVRVRTPGSTGFEPLTAPEQVRFGSIVDTRKGRVRIVIENGRGGLDTAEFYEGVFKLVQRRGIAELQLFGGSFKGCPRAPRAAGAAAVKRGKSVRHLWGSGSGAFRTKGRFSSATVRGTTWLTDDRCNGTLTKVTQGAMTVRDFVKRRSLVVRRGRTYFAAARATRR